MTFDQVFLLSLLVATMALFIWGRWRYDVIAFAALLAATVGGTVPFDAAFTGFGHPATITVAMVLVISRALINSGAVNLIAKHLVPPAKSASTHVGILSGVAGGLSAVMNNVGALALLMPAVLQSAAKVKRSPSIVLMPLAFGSILGGLVTLIGTPPNIIVAAFRADRAGVPFGMFDFTPVGGTVAIAGIAFVALFGWRLIPRSRQAKLSSHDLFEIENYVGEALVSAESPAIGQQLREIDDLVSEHDAIILGLLRNNRRVDPAGRHELVRAGDVLVIEAGPEALNKVIQELGLTPPSGAEGGKRKSLLGVDDVALAEAVVQTRSRMAGRSGAELRLRSRYGVNLLAVSREGAPFRGRLSAFRFRAGDVLLLEGDSDRLPEIVARLGCLPLAARGLQPSKYHMAEISVFIFAAAILAATFEILTIPVALALAAGLMVLLNIVPPRDIYDSVDWPVVVLLGAMIPIGQALEASGTTRLIAGALIDATAGFPPAVVLTLILIVTMTLSDVINNAATAVVMAPIAVEVAAKLAVSADPFLMAVAVGASCAFLTPIGHQNNTLIMGPGGYHFGDYWRMGLPLEVLIVVVAVPMLLWVWPLAAGS